MRKSTFAIGAIVALAAVLTVGLFASNMGFKLNYQLASAVDQVGTGPGGNNTLALPFNRQSMIDNAKQLMDDIGSIDVQQIAQFVEGDDAFSIVYTGRKGAGTPFGLVAGESNLVKMANTKQYIVVGSHDPALSVSLESAVDQVGTGPGGNNFFAYPYHSTASNAKQLMDDIGSVNVQQIAQFVEGDDAFSIVYTGRKGAGIPFDLIPGEGYAVKMATTVGYVPSHY